MISERPQTTSATIMLATLWAAKTIMRFAQSGWLQHVSLSHPSTRFNVGKKRTIKSTRSHAEKRRANTEHAPLEHYRCRNYREIDQC